MRVRQSSERHSSACRRRCGAYTKTCTHIYVHAGASASSRVVRPCAMQFRGNAAPTQRNSAPHYHLCMRASARGGGDARSLLASASCVFALRSAHSAQVYGRDCIRVKCLEVALYAEGRLKCPTVKTYGWETGSLCWEFMIFRVKCMLAYLQ